MSRFALVGLLALLAMSACRMSLEDEDGDDGTDDGMPGGRLCTVVTETPSCVAADAMQAVTLSWIEQNIFTPNCGTGSCHGVPAAGGSPGGRVVLTTASHDKLVNVDARFAAGRKLIVANDVPKSYLMVILKHTKLDEADPPAPAPSGGYMPLGTGPICCQKLDAMARWIMAGALNN